MKSKLYYIACLLVLLIPTTVQAAFEFTPPDSVASSMPTRAETAPESETGQSEAGQSEMGLAEMKSDTVSDTGADTSPEIKPDSPKMQVNEIAPPSTKLPVPTANQEVATTNQLSDPQPAPTSKAKGYSAENFKVVEGFASDIPMILALREVVPNEYGFSFEKGVDLGQRISWEGGRIWPAILRDILNPADLRFRISGNIVRIESGTSAPLQQPRSASTPSFIQQEIKRRRAQRQSRDESQSDKAASSDDSDEADSNIPPTELAPPKDLTRRSKSTKAPSRQRIQELLRNDDDRGTGIIPDVDQTNLPSQRDDITNRQQADLDRRQMAATQPQSVVKNEGQSELKHDFDQVLQDQEALTMGTRQSTQSAQSGMPTQLAQSVDRSDPLKISTEPVGQSTAPIDETSDPTTMDEKNENKTEDLADNLANGDISDALPPAPNAAVQEMQTNTAIATPLKLWQANNGSMLRDTLADWADRAGVQLNWQSDYDFELEAQVRIRGDFQKAVRTLLSGLQNTDPRPIARYHPNTSAGDPVLIIQTQRING